MKVLQFRSAERKEVDERLERIKASLERINALMAELRRESDEKETPE